MVELKRELDWKDMEAGMFVLGIPAHGSPIAAVVSQISDQNGAVHLDRLQLTNLATGNVWSEVNSMIGFRRTWWDITDMFETALRSTLERIDL